MTKTKFKKIFESFLPLFQLNNYDIYYFWKEKDTDEDGVAIDVSVDEDYQRVALNIYPVFWKQKIDEQVDMIIHELTHTITNEMNKQSENLLNGILVTKKNLDSANERATSKIAYMLSVFLGGGYKKYKKLYKEFSK